MRRARWPGRGDSRRPGRRAAGEEGEAEAVMSVSLAVGRGGARDGGCGRRSFKSVAFDWVQLALAPRRRGRGDDAGDARP